MSGPGMDAMEPDREPSSVDRPHVSPEQHAIIRALPGDDEDCKVHALDTLELIGSGEATGRIRDIVESGLAQDGLALCRDGLWRDAMVWNESAEGWDFDPIRAGLDIEP